jgi:hypothetical protein
MDPTICRLCGAVLAPAGGSRCQNCGLYSVAEVGRPLYIRVGAGLAGIYGLTALLVLLTR